MQLNIHEAFANVCEHFAKLRKLLFSNLHGRLLTKFMNLREQFAILCKLFMNTRIYILHNLAKCKQIFVKCSRMFMNISQNSGKFFATYRICTCFNKTHLYHVCQLALCAGLKGSLQRKITYAYYCLNMLI